MREELADLAKAGTSLLEKLGTLVDKGIEVLDGIIEETRGQ